MARILVDLDGVVVNYDFKKALKDVLGFTIQGNTAIMSYSLTDSLGLPPAVVDYFFWTLNHNRTKTEVLIGGAQEALKALSAKHRIVINTKRLKYCSMQTLREWLVKNKIPYHSIQPNLGAIAVQSVPLVCDYQIDDNVSKLVENLDAKVRLLFSQPWNLGCKDVGGMLRRVRSWAEIKSIIEEQEKLALGDLGG